MKIGEEHHRALERMYASAPINRFFAPELHVGDGRATVTMVIRSELFHSAGAVHGSVTFKAMDDAAFFAASSLVTDVFVLTASFTVYLLRPISEGSLRAEGRVVHASRNHLVAEAEAIDGTGRTIGRGSGSFLRSTIALGPQIGYG